MSVLLTEGVRVKKSLASQLLHKTWGVRCFSAGEKKGLAKQDLS
jgi:hypothetical protein